MGESPSPPPSLQRKSVVASWATRPLQCAASHRSIVRNPMN
jgi:hypothetical protein